MKLFQNDIDVDKINRVLEQVQRELHFAVGQFPESFHNAHEGFAVLKEEVDELWEAVRLNQKSPGRNDYIRREALQVAAMAVRLVLEVCP